MGEGAISYLNYCMNITTLINGIVISSISTVYYPHLIECYSEKRLDDYKKNVVDSLDLVSILVIPIISYMILFSNDIVKIIYERGEFTSTDTAVVSDILVVYLAGSLIYAFRYIYRTMFYSVKDTKIPALNELLCLVITMAANIVLIKIFKVGIQSMGIAWLLGLIIATPILIISFKKKYISVMSRALIEDVFKSILASIFSSVLLLWIKSNMSSWNVFARLLVCIMVLFTVYITLMIFVLKSKYILKTVNSFFRRGKSQ